MIYNMYKYSFKRIEESLFHPASQPLKIELKAFTCNSIINLKKIPMKVVTSSDVGPRNRFMIHDIYLDSVLLL